jgi:nucleotide-binding universal stress UspA family protein
MDALVERGVVAASSSIRIGDVSNGHMFVCRRTDGGRIPFYESFGHFIEALNREIDEHRYDLLIAAPPQRSRLGRWVTGNTTRKLALDLHTSLLVIRGGGPESRFLVCADGSASSRRQFPLLKKLLPAIAPPVDLIWVRRPKDDEQTVKKARSCLDHAREWLAGGDKAGQLIMVESDRRAEQIVQAAGRDTVIMMGASLRHDVYRMMMGSLPMQVLERAPASVLVVKLPPEADETFTKESFNCR